MPVKYLSQEWVDAYNTTVSASDAVAKAMKGKSAVLQMVIAEAPAGEVRYWLRIGDGTAAVGLGEASDAEVTISQSYDTAAAVDRGELDGAKAFTQGKVKIAGKMLKMMQLRGPLTDLQKALSVIEIEY
jgi:putative sterol carrier protein